MKILLLEDELMLQHSINEYLDELGHNCISFSDGLKAKECLESEHFDILILDIGVPNIDGLKLYEQVQKDKNISTIFISASIDIETIERAFNLGANDYLKKPFHLKELALRIQKIAKELDNKSRKHILLSSNYSYNIDEKVLKFKDSAEHLSNKQSNIIDFLCRNIEQIITLDILREYIWNGELVSDATIRAEISRLRRSLREDFIINIKGVGYKVTRYVPNL